MELFSISVLTNGETAVVLVECDKVESWGSHYYRLDGRSTEAHQLFASNYGYLPIGILVKSRLSRHVAVRTDVTVS